MSKKKTDYMSLLKGMKQKAAEDHDFYNQINDLKDLEKVIDGDAFSAENLKVPYVTADPIYEAPWK